MAELRLRVSEAAAAAPGIRALTLEAADGASLPAFEPGAHLKFTLPEIGERHYSLVAFAPEEMSAPASYRLGVLLEEGGQGGSRRMHELKPGDEIVCAEPKNDFALARGDAPEVLIAGGIGITPIASMAAALAAEGRPFRLHYAGRTRGRLAFVDELKSICGDALAIHCDDEPDTKIDLEALLRDLDPASQVHVCGPRGMIEAVRELALAAGLPKDHVHFELFSTPTDHAGDGAFDVEIASTGQVVTVPADKSIIEALEEAGVDLVYDCQRGDCGICQTDVLEGVPDHRDVVLSDEERASNKVMQICVSRAKTPKLVLDL